MDKYSVLKKYFGYDSFRQGQEKLIDAILSGRDALGVMPTGAGKSVCFQVPAMLLRGVTVVISPLISLMKDQVTSLNECGIPAVCINTSMSNSDIGDAAREILKGNVKLVYVAPERLLTSFFLSVCSKVKISLVAVDEAHCVSQWGNDFRTSYLDIKEFISRFDERPVVCALTATATPSVREDIVRLLALENPERVVTGFDRKNLYFEVVKPKDKYVALKRYLDLYSGRNGIIYCSSRKNVEELHEALLNEKYSVAKYHAGMTKNQRAENQERFIAGRKDIIIATNAFGMGIDKPDVGFVIHYNMPGDLESYYQEAGRAGRDGRNADCILLYGPYDVKTQQYFINNSERNPELSDAENERLLQVKKKKLAQMVDYCEREGCLRQYMLSYFGEQSLRCGNCSSCTGVLTSVDVTSAARKIFACVMHLGGNEKAETVRDVLKGNITDVVKEKSYNLLESFSQMSDSAQSVIDEHISRFTQSGYIKVKRDGSLTLDKKCKEVLSGKRAVRRLVERKTVKKLQERADIMLLMKLRALRHEYAVRLGLPDFSVFSDVSLVAMAKQLPESLSQLAEIQGIGVAKAEKYGAVFLKEIRKHCALNLEKK